MTVQNRVFRSAWTSWQELFNEASVFASQLGPKKVINISHSEDGNEAVVVVWYWSDDMTGAHDWS